MAEWRIGRGWSRSELASRLAEAEQLTRNFSPDELGRGEGWGRHASRALIAREAAGPRIAEGPFARGWLLVQRYAFSDPRIVRGHFDPSRPLLGRRMLLEARVLGLHYLGATMVSDVREDVFAERTVCGYRYDTLQGHFERGFEWFVLTKDHASGDVTFSISATWRRGDLPNVWSRLGFRVLARRYQRAWHRLAHLRLRTLLGSRDLPPLPGGRNLVQEGPELDLPMPQRIASLAKPSEIAFEDEKPERPG